MPLETCDAIRDEPWARGWDEVVIEAGVTAERIRPDILLPATMVRRSNPRLRQASHSDRNAGELILPHTKSYSAAV